MPHKNTQRRGNRILNDHFFTEAKKGLYVSRAAFKLQQIDDKCSVIKPNSCVLDLGCFPGAWLQVACQRLGPAAKGGKVVGIDLKELPQIPAHCDSRVEVRLLPFGTVNRDAEGTRLPPLVIGSATSCCTAAAAAALAECLTNASPDCPIPC